MNRKSHEILSSSNANRIEHQVDSSDILGISYDRIIFSLQRLRILDGAPFDLNQTIAKTKRRQGHVNRAPGKAYQYKNHRARSPAPNFSIWVPHQ